MASDTIVPAFDFSTALGLPLADRFQRCLRRAHEIAAEYQQFLDAPCVPAGASDEELQKMESDLGCTLPPEYRAFLKVSRYLKLGDGFEVGGLDHQGTYFVRPPWVSTKHRAGSQFLVFADYWHYADGDQLLIDLADASFPVLAYLHEDGPLYAPFAPYFSLALWRLVHES